MANEELINYIKQVRTQGFKDSDIKEHLLAHGYTNELINEAFNVLNPPIIPNTPIPEKMPEKKEKRKKKIPILVHALVLISLIGVILWFQIPKSSEKCQEAVLDIHELNNEKIICSFPDNSKIQMILKNNGDESINFVDIKVIGKSDSFFNRFSKRIDNLNLLPEDVSTNVIDYGKGEISSIEIIPGVLDEGNKYICSQKKISFENIKPC